MVESRSTKHLEMLQGAIDRIAGYSFVAKGWSVTVATAILGLAAKDGGPQFLWIGFLAVLLFWLIDAYYLSLERGFRALFEQAVARYANNTEVESFDMMPRTGIGSVLSAALRPAVVMVHAPLIARLDLRFTSCRIR